MRVPLPSALARQVQGAQQPAHHAPSAQSAAQLPQQASSLQQTSQLLVEQPPYSGLFITFEGIDGVGKSTQVVRLRKYAESLGWRVVVTREPGGTALGQQLRQLLLDTHADSAAQAECSPRAEALLFAADRAQHVEQVILPALREGALVISDRYVDSSLAYQAGGRELTRAQITMLNQFASGGLMPDRTYLLDMTPQLALLRRKRREQDRMESAGLAFAARVRSEFIAIAQSPSAAQRVRLLDASEAMGKLSRMIAHDFMQLQRAHRDALAVQAAAHAATPSVSRETPNMAAPDSAAPVAAALSNSALANTVPVAAASHTAAPHIGVTPRIMASRNRIDHASHANHAEYGDTINHHMNDINTNINTNSDANNTNSDANNTHLTDHALGNRS